MYEPGTKRLIGAEVVVDKDRASALLAEQLDADLFVMATDVEAVFTGWGTPEQAAILLATSRAFLRAHDHAALASEIGAALDRIVQPWTWTVAFIGDDVNDLPALERVGLACAVADAMEPVKAVAHYVTRKRGGDGAVREVCELLIAAREAGS